MAQQRYRTVRHLDDERPSDRRQFQSVDDPAIDPAVGLVAGRVDGQATEAGATTQASAASANKINAILDRWQGVEASKGGNVALWRDIMNIQLKHVSPGTLDRLLALNVGDNAADKAQFYQSFVHVLGTDIALRLQAHKI